MHLVVSNQIPIADQLDAEFFYLRPHARADEGGEFMLELVERRVRVKLGIAGRQNRQQLQNIGFIHAGVLQEAENALRVADVFLPQGGLRGPGQEKINRRIDRKSTRLNSSHLGISYAVFCLKKKYKKHVENAYLRAPATYQRSAQRSGER